MNPEQHRRLREIFDQACRLDTVAQDEFLDGVCDDEEIRTEVRKLLAADLETDVDLAKPANQGQPLPAGSLPDRIGPYRILSEIGVGGMGTVYEAEQSSPRRTVALKVITPGYESEGVTERFRREAELLGRLQHNGIARIYEAGYFQAERGGPPRPFFAMELVRGQPLSAFAKQQKLGTRERLTLVRDICQAVRHAHDRGIVHRDLKPSNILVTQEGEAKILDFGIARPLQAGVADVTVHTRTGQIVGTVAYMSPEQASGDSDGVDHRADVYALGVIAYELLTGRPPFDLAGAMLHEAVRIIREDEPPSLATTDRGLAGDIDTIVRKALAKEPDRRYPSAAELARDIDCYLSEQPISARPPSTWYQLAKFSRRNRALVTSVAVTFGFLLVALVVTGIALRRSIASQRLAAEESLQANTALNILYSSLTSANPNIEGNANYTVAQLMDDIVAKLNDREGLRPKAEAELRQTVADTYVGLGRYEDAIEQLQGAVRLWSQVEGEDAARTMVARTELAAARLDVGDYERAHEELVKIVQVSEQHWGPTDENTLERIYYLANASFRLGQFEQAEQLFRDSVERRAQLHGDADEQTLAALTSLGLVLQQNGKLEEAQAVSERSVAGYVQLMGAEHPYTLTARSNLAMLLRRVSDLDAAEREFREILQIRRRTLPADHSDIGVGLALLGNTLTMQDRLEEAEVPLLEAYELLKRVLGEDHQFTQKSAGMLVTLYRKMERTSDVEIWRARAGNHASP